jgi:hypothetical protein
MGLRQLAVVGLAIVLATPPLGAQASSDAQAWRVLAGQLGPNAYVLVRLKDGREIKGHVVQVSGDVLRINPRTRIPSPLRQVSFDEIARIDRRNEPRWNPASKVLLGVGITVGAVFIAYLVALASAYD